jgi:hypothetical protein
MRKYELIMLSKTIQSHRNVADIVSFFTQLFDNVDKQQFFLTYELTLFVYNIVLNSNNDYDYFFNRQLKAQTKQKVIQTIQQIFSDVKFTEEQLNKINNDLVFIERHKEYIYIHDIVWYIYFFFFKDV